MLRYAQHDSPGVVGETSSCLSEQWISLLSPESHVHHLRSKQKRNAAGGILILAQAIIGRSRALPRELESSDAFRKRIG